MFCSNCGAQLGATAHIYGNDLLCDACFQKLEIAQENPANKIMLSSHEDTDRAKASESIPQESVPEVASPNAPPIAMQHSFLLYPQEQILWKRTFSKGIIHREATLTEAVTSQRALVVDDVLRAIVRAAPLANSVVVVTNTRRNSTGVRTGFEHYGNYASTGFGNSYTTGDVDFMMGGNVVVSFRNVKDPQGLKRLVQGAVKSQ